SSQRSPSKKMSVIDRHTPSNDGIHLRIRTDNVVFREKMIVVIYKSFPEEKLAVGTVIPILYGIANMQHEYFKLGHLNWVEPVRIQFRCKNKSNSCRGNRSSQRPSPERPMHCKR